jgi:hypothetical protein
MEIVFFAFEKFKSLFMKNLFFLLMVIATAACSQKKGKDSNSALFGEGKPLAELTDKKRLGELSGLAASANNPGMLWSHNDSGNRSEIFLLDQKLNIKLTCRLRGIVCRDWEDITVGPGPEEGKNYIYVGEIGDNMAIFQYKHIYRFPEPTFDASKTEVVITEFDTITFQLADKRKDTESLLIDPKTKNLYVISKRENPVHVYELKYPYPTADTLTVNSIGTIPYAQIVGGDFSVDGRELLIKNYDNVFYWKLGDTPLRDVLTEKPFILNYTGEPQGESITFARDGSGFFTVSEIVKGEKSYLYFYPRAK